ncbi:unnamed protein product [Rotaria sp. Silwood2]|nr:unnamed protein product [Rotaria sp. Silwood2]CAF2652081.1 unnamed protein product [Rotaria sp. Silwood2]CAF2900263.1 unnamed protein product [Rotaria sp. Silwood2]CAF3063291.1 unnamed protein product [Rotaria sp. Silwood2]CAF3936836.1 unnamed protein product [Rotaria sp. Silwood2]
MGEKSLKNKSPSEFYFACRNNDIETVRRLLDEYPLEDLDKMESNGSTALHAACFYKHVDIVKLLLDRGFTRRVINKYNYTPLDECESEEIRQLFIRSKTSNRFGGDVSYEQEKLTWIIIDGNEQNVIHDRVLDTYNGNRLEYKVFHGDKILQQLGNNMPKIGLIRRLFHRAINEKDCTRLIQAYTTDTDFCNQINNYLITQQEESTNNSSIQTNVMSEFIDTIFFNRQLHEQYQFQGICYRSMKIKSDNDLNIYRVGTKLINRTFISATKDRQFAEKYVCDRSAEKKYAVIISFEIRQFNTALDIEYLSEFPSEKEILIMNKRIFKVVRIKMKNSFDVEIELRESKSTRVNQKDISSGYLGLFH